MKTQKNKTTIKKKKKSNNKKPPKETHKDKIKQNKTKDEKDTHPIFLNDFSHVVYLSLHQNLLSTMHFTLLKLCYLLNAIFSRSNRFL